jgi:type I restriction enzyme S subunit
MKATRKDFEYISETIRKFFPKNEYKILIFGSYPRKSANEFSDIDIAIKGSNKLPLLQWQLMEEEFSESELPKKVDLVDYQRVAKSFQKIIDSEGVDFDGFVAKLQS